MTAEGDVRADAAGALRCAGGRADHPLDARGLDMGAGLMRLVDLSASSRQTTSFPCVEGCK